MNTVNNAKTAFYCLLFEQKNQKSSRTVASLHWPLIRLTHNNYQNACTPPIVILCVILIEKLLWRFFFIIFHMCSDFLTFWTFRFEFRDGLLEIISCELLYRNLVALLKSVKLKLSFSSKKLRFRIKILEFRCKGGE